MKGQKDWREYELHCVQAHHVRLWRLQFNVETGGNKEFDLKDSPALLSVALAYHLVRGEWDLLLRLFHLPPLFLLAPAFSPTACTEKAWQRVRVRVCATRSLGKRALLRNYKQEEGHIHHKHAPPSLQTHTVHNSLSLLATVPNCNNGCFLKTRVMVTSWATSRRCVKAQELTNRKEPRSYSTTNHHSKGFLWEGPAQQRNWFHIHALFPKTSSSNYTNISQGKVQLTGLLLLNAVWLSF